jgi:hypothetical protein
MTEKKMCSVPLNILCRKPSLSTHLLLHNWREEMTSHWTLSTNYVPIQSIIFLYFHVNLQSTSKKKNSVEIKRISLCLP